MTKKIIALCSKDFRDKSNNLTLVIKGNLYKGTVERIQFLVDKGVCEFIDNSQLDVLLLSKYAKHTGGPNFITSDGKKFIGKAKTLEYIKENVLDK
ncbi:hypothetical protein K4Q81_01695 [Staphylococcus epidermidis]|uniref:hypothetical protein n=1 Tax=Staphylococcus TaxID=1279 RepID=UPI0008A8592C|nr:MULTISPECIES: hypothetical protein [Staphylococcus]MBF2232009.1 hypothetical protein [Staphylococcus epidermidis]MBF2284347.1 hypothetical protein [Staphylococcus epidermidis]MBF2289074.1 hypothetical protein [Staphylococcus epidermidis]MBF2291222.1 hypothetical protein [Staphylococcus epidermidis]MBF2293843.1 hypothetical protein [Staphylococcus epidermidis]